MHRYRHYKSNIVCQSTHVIPLGVSVPVSSPSSSSSPSDSSSLLLGSSSSANDPHNVRSTFASNCFSWEPSSGAPESYGVDRQIELTTIWE